MCKPVYAIDTPAGRIGIFEGDESEDFHGIRIFWIDENDAVIDLIAMIDDEVMSVLKGTDGFYRYVDDGTSEEIECEWSEVPEDWRGKGDPDYTEEFREVAERELDGKERHMVLSALVKKG